MHPTDPTDAIGQVPAEQGAEHAAEDLADGRELPEVIDGVLGERATAVSAGVRGVVEVPDEEDELIEHAHREAGDQGGAGDDGDNDEDEVQVEVAPPTYFGGHRQYPCCDID